MNNVRVVTVVLFLLLFSCAAQQTANSNHVIIYSSNLNGELEPCGCSEEGNLGGIKRRSTLIKRLRNQFPDLLLISGGGLLVSDSERDRLKSEYILKGLATMNYDAVGIQWRDLAYGPGFLQRHLPWVSSNWLSKTFPRHKSIRKSGMEYLFYSWLEPEASPWRKMQSKKRVVSDDYRKLLQDIKAQKNRHRITILSSNLPWQAIKTWPLNGVDILIIQANHEKFIPPRKEGSTLVLQAGSRGMRLGQLQIQLNDQGHIDSWQHDQISMGKEMQDDPALGPWYQDYNDQVKQAYLEKVKKRKIYQQGKSPFAGSEVCQGCHKKAHEIWSASKHANAFNALEKVNKAFDPDCIVCHTLGFEQPGGYLDLRSTPDLINVQCENCHGAAKRHADSAGKKKPVSMSAKGIDICRQCHNQSHSPGFDFTRYWDNIRHGKK